MPKSKPKPKPANRAKTGKRTPNKTAWKPGQSGNPAGKPKDGESWAAIIKAVGNMYPEDLLEFIPATSDLGRSLAVLPRGVQIKYLVAARVFAALMFDPDPRLLIGLMDRAEGKVKEMIDVSGTLGIENLPGVWAKVYGKPNNDPS